MVSRAGIVSKVPCASVCREVFTSRINAEECTRWVMGYIHLLQFIYFCDYWNIVDIRCYIMQLDSDGADKEAFRELREYFVLMFSDFETSHYPTF